jgi:alpha-amylase/alpha-mannosidase (GH57 family)
MATLTFLWHLHQPAYCTADGMAHAPWAALHAGGSYATLTQAIIDAGGRGQVVNIVPTLIEQLEGYANGEIYDPVVEALIRPASELGEELRITLVDWAFHVTGRQLDRYPRLRELASRRTTLRTPKRLAAFFGPADLRDLQVLFILAQAGDRAWEDQRLRSIYGKQRQFTSEEHTLAADWLQSQPGELLELWGQLARQEGAEISTSPYAHPIMPLLADTAIVNDSWSPNEPPMVPAFSNPDDAAAQLAIGLELMRKLDFDPVGCWPPEGSVSRQALALYAEQGVRWLVTDEGILERSLNRPLRGQERPATELYTPWRLETPSPTLFFRDRWLSDRIGFVYGHWDDEARSARDLVSHITTLARALPEDASIVLALDGENPWLHYPEGGGHFLRELMQQIDACPELQPATLAELSDRLEPQALSHLHPGSWIGATFATWIGHPEKTRAWEVLAAVRNALAESGQDLPRSMLLAEGSDWFWWLGDDNPTQLAPLYDRIFRMHLADACQAAGIEPPLDLDKPLKTVTVPIRVPCSAQWQAPVLDGRITSYFEWSIAAWIEATISQPLFRVALWASPEKLHLLIEGTRAMSELVQEAPLSINLLATSGHELSLSISDSGCDEIPAECAVGQVAELSIPWDGSQGSRLEIRLGPCSLPSGGAAMVLEPIMVDGDLNV